MANLVDKILIRLVKCFDSSHWFVSRFIIKSLEFLLGGKSIAHPATIVVLRNCFFGDFIVTIPALRELRRCYPSSRFVLLTTTAFSKNWGRNSVDKGIFGVEDGLIDEVVVLSRNDIFKESGRGLIRSKIAADSLTITIALCYSGESLIARLKRIVLCKVLRLPFPHGLCEPVTLPFKKLDKWRVGRSDVLHQYQSALASISEVTRYSGSSNYSPQPNPVRNRSKNIGESLSIGLAPFSKQPVKQWPIERFVFIIEQLSKKFNINFEIYGGVEDICKSDNLVSSFSRQVKIKSFCGATSPAELRKRIENIDLLICVDSGPMHLACLTGTPLVAVFSQIALHQYWRPWGGRSATVSTNVACSQCGTQNGMCPNQTNACINNISDELVFSKTLEMLENNEEPS
jgi:ADP-heptose:LPS heptosyltransferase